MGYEMASTIAASASWMRPLVAAGCFAAGFSAAESAKADVSGPGTLTIFGGATGGTAIGSPLGKPAGVLGLRTSGSIAGETKGENDSFLLSAQWNAIAVFSAGAVSYVNGDRNYSMRFCGGLTGKMGYFGDTSVGLQADLDLCGGFTYLERSRSEGSYGGLAGALWRTGIYITKDRQDMNAAIKNWRFVPGIMGFLNFYGLSPESSFFNPVKFKNGFGNIPGPKLFPFFEIGFGW